MKPERKSFKPAEFKLAETGEVSVAFSRFDVLDHDNDVTRKEAIPVGVEVAMSDFGHSSWDSAPPVGKGVIGLGDGVATFNGAFFLNTDHGRNAYETVKAMGDLQEWSYGFRVTKSKPITFEGTSAQEILGLDIYEVSPVLKGAGISTHTLAIKSDGPDPAMSFAEHLDWTLDQVKALLERAKSRKALRESEGRDLSTDNTDRLAELLDDLKALLPTPEPVKARDNTLEVEIERARALGVLITATNE